MKIYASSILAFAFAFGFWLPAEAAPEWVDHNGHDPGITRGGTADFLLGAVSQHNQSDLDFLKERARRIAEGAAMIRGWDPEKKEKIEGHQQTVQEDAGATITFGDGEHGARVKVQFPWER